MSDRDVLSDEVKPTHYKLDLYNLDLAKWTFDGTVAITVDISRPTRKITLNSNQLVLKAAKVLVGGNVHAESNSFSYDESTQSVCMSFENELPTTNDAVLVITFQGIINDSMAGFYRGSYSPTVDPVPSVNRGTDSPCFALITQFQANDARRAFPCFDAPNIKATFDVSIEVPTDQVALSNTPIKSTTPTKDGWHVVAFETAPRMSTYLLAWAVGDFAYVEAFTEREYNGQKIPVRVYAVRGTEDQGKFALSVAPRVIDLFSDLFNLPYPLKKMDLLAAPELTMNGMENWGLITAQPSELLFNETTANDGFRQSVASNVSHEIAHQWFGNLVTMEWWDEIWLNEGFATWLGDYAVDYLFPEWHIWAQFVSNRMEIAFGLDSLRASHPVQVPVSSGMLAHQALNQISYGKGCSVVRMLVNFLGAEIFMRGVSNYLKANEYGNAKAESLWKHLAEASGKDVAAMADSWINVVGHPVVTVEEHAADKSLSLTQARFLATGDIYPEDDKALWHIPLGIKGLQGGQDAFLSTKTKFISGVDDAFYLINTEGTGFYKVQYPQSRLAKLSTQLVKLTPQDKVVILGSTAALASAGFSSVTSLLTFLEGFRREKDVVVWRQIVNILAAIHSTFSDDEQIKTGLNRFKLELMKDKVNELGVNIAADETSSSRELRRLLHVAAIRSGDDELIDRYMPLFAKWQEKGKIDPSSISAVLCAAMLNDPAHTYDIFKEALFKSNLPDEKMILRVSLARTEDENIMRKLVALNFATEPPGEIIQPMEMGEIMETLANHPTGRQIQWQYMKDNWDTVTAKIGHPILMDHCVSLSLGGFATEADLAEIDEFFKDKDTSGYSQNLENSKQEIRSRAAYGQRGSQSLKQWLMENKYIQ